MSHSPVIELQFLAGDPNSDIVAVLLKAKMIAVKLDLADLAEWIELELNGYPTIASVPEYRSGQGQLKALNPLRGWIPVDLGVSDPKITTPLTTFKLTESIASMKRLKDKDVGTVSLPIPAGYAQMLHHGQRSRYEVRWFFSSGKIDHVITTVRNKILDWSLELEKKGVFGEGLVFTIKEKEVAPMTVNNTNIFHGSVNNAGAIGAGNVGDVSQQNSITVGDISSLERELKKYGLEDVDVSEMKRIIDKAPQPTSKKEVEKKFGAWIGNITGKAFTGVLNIAGAAAPAILTNALCNFYNIPV
ncbi:abortive phage resistance protein [Serratia nematodiphila]|uniref:AbiTii domain-containing protein n=1 Tax=Serratia nematodiphila TaxID=458197 RepID=UPI0011D85463|nr:abortive phage resistance protein [Serratia nematodiphila]TXE62523.1 abortive phage resistance protein [Serratia nematodiphila]